LFTTAPANGLARKRRIELGTRRSPASKMLEPKPTGCGARTKYTIDSNIMYIVRPTTKAAVREEDVSLA
jgi:hypothetical protein